MTVSMKKGDRLPLLRAALKGSDGAALDLNGASVTFRMRPTLGGALKVNAGATIIGSPSDGVVQYAWGATDTDTVGTFDGEFAVSISGLIETVPNSGYVTIEIGEKLT